MKKQHTPYIFKEYGIMIYSHISHVMSGRRNLLIVLCLLITLISTTGWTKEKKLVLNTCNWEPFWGEKLVNGGYVMEITREAFLRAGYEIEVKFVPWKRALEETKEGDVDGVIGMNYSEERAQTYYLTNVVYVEENGFFRKKGSSITYTTLHDLTPYTIGYIRGGSFGATFDKATYLKKEDVTDNEQNINKLMLGRIDVFISSKLLILYMLATKYPEFQGEIEFIEPAFEMINVHHAISRANPNAKKIVADFNQRLKEITDDGTVAKIIKMRGF
ncbi:MAG: transporter substrate-binding domain-containing protein [Desulfamplus sp.]|nr:transporter substrate-binding domain-containing protein [Desulfamplus sp.]